MRYQEGDEGYDVFLKYAKYEDVDEFYFLQFFKDCSQTQRFSWTYSQKGLCLQHRARAILSWKKPMIMQLEAPYIRTVVQYCLFRAWTWAGALDSRHFLSMLH